jgi:multidrug efflux pump subunit AcrA (membrane-fusion protein)
MYARGEIITHKEANALVIPRDSLIAEKDETEHAGVYVVKETTARRVEIVIGDTQIEDVWVRSGLKEGELVISEIGPSLKDGVPVQIAQ